MLVSIISRAGVDSQLQSQIIYSGSAAQFFPLLVTLLLQYGTLADGRNPIIAILETAKDLVGQDKKYYCDTLIQEIRAASNIAPQSFDLLIIDDTDTWRKNILEIFEDIYDCDVANSYEIAMEKIHKNNYKIVCTNWNIGGGTIRYSDKGWKLLNFLKCRYAELPIVLITGDINLFTGDPEENLQNLRNNYANIKRIIIKGQTEEFVKKLEQAVAQLMRNEIPNLFSQNELIFKEQKGVIMITELLTVETIKAAVPFLINQFSKLTDRINKEQLDKIQQKAQTVKTDQDVEEVKQFIQKVVPDANQITSVAAFTAWVEDAIDSDFNELLGVGELTFKVLREVRKEEKNQMKQDGFKQMENLLKVQLVEFSDKLKYGTATPHDKVALYDRVTRSLDFIKG